MLLWAWLEAWSATHGEHMSVPSRAHVPIAWLTPPPGVVKINIDASLKKNAQFASVGLIAPNELGCALATILDCFTYSREDPTYVKEQAIHVGL